jgi:hypothetical protein
MNNFQYDITFCDYEFCKSKLKCERYIRFIKLERREYISVNIPEITEENQIIEKCPIFWKKEK